MNVLVLYIYYFSLHLFDKHLTLSKDKNNNNNNSKSLAYLAMYIIWFSCLHLVVYLHCIHIHCTIFVFPSSLLFLFFLSRFFHCSIWPLFVVNVKHVFLQLTDATGAKVKKRTIMRQRILLK